MKTKTFFAELTVILLLLVATAGWSCGQGYGISNIEPTDTGDARETTKMYQNEEWGVSFRYPANWYYREYREIIEGAEEITLAFSDTPLPETLPPEPLFPVMVSRDTRTVDEIAAIHVDAISTENTTIGGRSVKIVTRYSDILEQNYSIYLVSLRVGSIQFLPLDPRYVSTAENMISTIVETE